LISLAKSNHCSALILGSVHCFHWWYGLQQWVGYNQEAGQAYCRLVGEVHIG